MQQVMTKRSRKPPSLSSFPFKLTQNHKGSSGQVPRPSKLTGGRLRRSGGYFEEGERERKWRKKRRVGPNLYLE